MKRLVSILLSVIFAVMCCIPVSADMSTYAIGSASRTSYLSVTNNSASCKSEYREASSNGIKQVVMVQTLEKHWGLCMWDPVANANWTKTVSNPTNVSMVNTKSGLVNGTYRLKTEFTVTASNGQSETITVYSSEKTI